MLKITDLKVNNLREGCITDSAPYLSFALVSDIHGEALAAATISCGSWKITTTDQLDIRCDVELKPYTGYEVFVEATGTSGETAKAAVRFQTGRLDTPWTASWITDGTYDFAKKSRRCR